MIDPRLLKDDPKLVQQMLDRRNLTDFPIDRLVGLDKRRREFIIETQTLRQKKNILSEAIATKKKTKQEVSAELNEMKDVSGNLASVEQIMTEIEQEFNQLFAALPNLLHDSVPRGKDGRDNVVIHDVGKARSFDFPAKDHVDIAVRLDLVDMERAAKISGARFYFLKNELVRMNQALVQFALDFLSQKGYTPIQPPYMIRKAPMAGAVILGDFQDVIYKIDGEDLYLIGTSEHAIAGMHMNEILEGKKLPIKYAGFSPCFRKEAGAHGKDMKGIFRVHQFEKVEQFVYCRQEDSWKMHEQMLTLAEDFLSKLDIPFRVVLLCSGDTGKVSAKTYDIEAWMAGQDAYREIISCSNCVDYQARRLAIRYRDKTNEETRLVHTLNSTLVATERMLVAILENYQTRDGSVRIPDALQKYMNDAKEIRLRS